MNLNEKKNVNDYTNLLYFWSDNFKKFENGLNKIIDFT